MDWAPLSFFALLFNLKSFIEGWFRKFPLIIGLFSILFLSKYLKNLSLFLLNFLSNKIGNPNQLGFRWFEAFRKVNWLFQFFELVNFFIIFFLLKSLIFINFFILFNWLFPIAAVKSNGLKLKPELKKRNLSSILLYFFLIRDWVLYP